MRALGYTPFANSDSYCRSGLWNQKLQCQQVSEGFPVNRPEPKNTSLKHQNQAKWRP